ncbi:hypothetical protein HFD88_000940 [Aspergillus terreus]|nr:hypothetical protein HFD88_000940 [Aspergillus terreus]
MEPRPDHQFDPFGPDAAAYDDSKFDPGAMPMPEIKTPAEVRREARARLDKIFASYETLHEILRRHEGTIQKRWFKKTRAQRLKVLLTAWPNMPTIHRPDFAAFRRESELDRCSGTKYGEHFMWPYINQEDLLNPKVLPLLLNARGRHDPSHFAAADVDAVRLGFVVKAVVPIFLNGHERLLTFLVQCCLEVLHDIPQSTLTSDSFPILPEPQLKPEREINGFESLSVMAAEAPYRVPAQLDLHRVESLLTARASAAEDHLWALREAPDYFSCTLLEAKEHRQEILKDINSNDHPVFRHGRGHILWGRIIGNVVWDAYHELELFSELSSQAKKLASLQKKYANAISPSKDLPEEFLEALLRFRFFVDQAARGPLSKLRQAVVASPPMRKFCAREPPPDPYTTMIVVRTKPGIRMGDVEQQLFWLLRTLWEDGKPLLFARLPLVVDELERLIQFEKQAQELLSASIIATIGDISIISQCLTQLDLYQPWARSFTAEFVPRKAQFKKEYADMTSPWAQMHRAIQETSKSTNVTSLGEPSGGKFTYPIDKRRTKENVAALRRAEANLDAFWEAIDQAMLRKVGGLRGTAVRRLLSQPRILQRTPEWVEPTPTASAQVKKGEADLNASYQPLSTIYTDLRSTKVEVARPKAKVKTRGTPRPVAKSPTEAEPVLQPNPIDPQPSFPVDARALKVFRTIFFNPAVTSTPGEIPWNDFLHAMTYAGFTVMKLYGSVWQFQPTKLDVERSIQFHEPHPRGKIPFTTARRYGRRLHRAYGWFGEMFTLDAK